ncbi:alaserpin-like isoform X2 [Leptopilina heterotoma]|uniref:alaserpin-like isoform X2 n=1 Tax=Leptopilina heterotoma TaxID=63436 RepID=UPI001CA7F69D|nr:alaserpin-like isoform X2 [Leptopilina heterotoma]
MQLLIAIGIFVICIKADTLDKSSLRIISDSINDFSSRFSKYLGEREKFNYVSSPLGLDLSLAMLAFGSDGSTSEELYRSLHLPSDPTVSLNGYQNLLNLIKENQESSLIISPKIFIHKDAVINESYSSLIAQYFHSEIGHVNFEDPISAAGDINLYTYGRTRKRIQTFITPEEIYPDESVMSINVIYFRGKFLQSFNKSLINQPFFTDETNARRVKSMCGMMKQLYYGEVPELKASFIEIPYESRELTLLLMRPNEISGVKELQRKLEKFTITRLLSYGNLRDVSVSIPLINVESYLNFKDILQKMGIYSIFEDYASFTEFFDEERKIRLDKITQKVVFNMDEERTFFSGATFYSHPQNGPGDIHSTLYTFYLDRPFLFMVLQKDTLIPIISGRIIDPEPYDSWRI